MIPTHRGVVVAKNGVVAASQPLAVSAGLDVLQRGGNFVDAAIATSAVLSVTEPYTNHLGGDAFVTVFDAARKQTLAFNASGAAPKAASRDRFPKGIPLRGLAAASVPGHVSCWFALHERYGSKPMSDLLRPAHSYAADGFAAGYRYSQTLTLALQHSPQDWVTAMAHSLGVDSPPHPGAIIRQPELAWTLEQIAHGGRHAFYDGVVTERIINFSQRHGGLFSREDFAQHQTQVSDPIHTDYRGFTIHGQPPVSQGHILLQELNLAEGFDLGRMGFGTADAIHVQVEAKKLAFADRARYLSDPKFVKIPMDRLLSKEYSAERRKLIDLNHAGAHVEAGNAGSDTTYFCVADKHGNGISYIQSVFHGFGCGVVADGTGVLFNNRMTGFSLAEGDVNVLAPGKRTAHTLNTYLITKDGRLAWVGGTPGGHVQVQSNFQVICNIIDFGMNPQQAIEAPRWQHGSSTDMAGPGVLEVEDRIDKSVIADLARRGHVVRAIGPWAHGSAYQLIQIDPESGAYHAGSDPRVDGHAAGF